MQNLFDLMQAVIALAGFFIILVLLFTAIAALWPLPSRKRRGDKYHRQASNDRIMQRMYKGGR